MRVFWEYMLLRNASAGGFSEIVTKCALRVCGRDNGADFIDRSSMTSAFTVALRFSALRFALVRRS